MRALCDVFTMLPSCTQYRPLLFRQRYPHQRNKTFSLSDDEMETEPRRFLLCVDQQETVCMKLITCNQYDATGFLCV
jgi:hypothetical protein